MKDKILTAYILGKGSGKIELNCGRHLEPGLSGSHSGSHIGGTYAGRKCTERTICAGMGISTDYNVSGNCKTFFGKECMLDTHLTDFEIVGDLISSSKFPDAFAVFR